MTKQLSTGYRVMRLRQNPPFVTLSPITPSAHRPSQLLLNTDNPLFSLLSESLLIRHRYRTTGLHSDTINHGPSTAGAFEAAEPGGDWRQWLNSIVVVNPSRLLKLSRCPSVAPLLPSELGSARPRGDPVRHTGICQARHIACMTSI